MSTGFFPLSGLARQTQHSFGFQNPTTIRPLATTVQAEELLAADCVVAIGVSGGKDSQACALGTLRYLDEIRHRGPRLLVHADLGSVEWKDSLPSCERLAAHLGIELIVVRRKAGGMLTRWRKRWTSNVARYRELSCVRLILPWSTPSMRFCTSELKVAPITSELKRRYPHHAILNVSGIRRQESQARSRMPISAIELKLDRKNYAGVNWNPIADWTIADVLEEIGIAGLALHEAYTRYGSSRVSCAFCIMGSMHDLTASATCQQNQDVFREIVTLEADSTFAFQGTRWLADVGPHLLPASLSDRVQEAKRRGDARRKIEAEIPKHLLYTKGWPTSIPTAGEAELVANVRCRVSDLLVLDAGYLTGDSVRARYAELIEQRLLKERTRKARSKIRRAGSDEAGFNQGTMFHQEAA